MLQPRIAIQCKHEVFTINGLSINISFAKVKNAFGTAIRDVLIRYHDRDR
jgi:hypothetical protein